MKRTRMLVVGGLILVGVSIFYFSFAPGEQPVATFPTADLDFEYHPTNESVTVIHSKGETIDSQDTKALEVYVFPATETRPASSRTTIDLPFTEGDAVTIANVSESDRVVILLQGASNSHIVGNYSVRNGES